MHSINCFWNLIALLVIAHSLSTSEIFQTLTLRKYQKWPEKGDCDCIISQRKQIGHINSMARLSVMRSRKYSPLTEQSVQPNNILDLGLLLHIWVQVLQIYLAGFNCLHIERHFLILDLSLLHIVWANSPLYSRSSPYIWAGQSTHPTRSSGNYSTLRTQHWPLLWNKE